MKFLYDLIALIFALIINLFISDTSLIILNTLSIFGVYKLIDSFVENIIRGDWNESGNYHKYVYNSRWDSSIWRERNS